MDRNIIKDRLRNIVDDLSAMNNIYSNNSYYKEMYMPYGSRSAEAVKPNNTCSEYAKYLEYYSRKLLEIIEDQEVKG